MTSPVYTPVLNHHPALLCPTISWPVPACWVYSLVWIKKSWLPQANAILSPGAYGLWRMGTWSTLALYLIVCSPSQITHNTFQILFFAKYSGSLLLHRRSLDAFYWQRFDREWVYRGPSLWSWREPEYIYRTQWKPELLFKQGFTYVGLDLHYGLGSLQGRWCPSCERSRVGIVGKRPPSLQQSPLLRISWFWSIGSHAERDGGTLFSLGVVIAV